MPAIIKGLRDTLDEDVARFAPPPLDHPIFLNSIPKGGTHLIRNIVRMFVPVDQHYERDFLQIPNLRMHLRALDPAKPMLSCGHMLYSDDSVMAIGAARHVVLVRDPYDWVLARLRFHLSDEFQQPVLAHLKSGQIPLNDLLNMMIVGIHEKSPSLQDIYLNNAVAWYGTAVTLIKYEDIRDAVLDLESKRSERFFTNLLEVVGLERPDDWRERVRVGSDKRQSRTARENLNMVAVYDIPDELPSAQKRLLDVAAPGIRALLGYA